MMLRAILCNSDIDLHCKCEFSKEFLNKVIKKIDADCGVSEWNDVVLNFVEKFNGNSIGIIIGKLCPTASVYFLWQERNYIIFGDERRSINELYNMLYEMVKLRLISLKAKITNAVRKTQLD
ncbi:hypothetical protein Tco_0337114 [Tanacetum coccineum]